MNTSIRVVLAVLGSALLGACAAQDHAQPSQAPYTDYASFAATPDIPSADAIHLLNSDQQAYFLQYFHDPAQAELPPHRRLAQFIASFGEAFTFYDDTLTASDTFTKERGNCLSLAILTTALAELVDVEVQFQLVEAIPVYSLEGAITLKQQHVRSYIYTPVTKAAIGSNIRRPPGITIDYFPSGNEIFVGNISREHYIAMFYRNLAAEALIEGRHDRGFALLQASLGFAPDHPDALNMMAVLHRRVGDSSRAEKIYRHAIVDNPENVSLLKNYQLLLASQGRGSESEQLGQKLLLLEDPSPVNWIAAGDVAYEQGEYRQAKALYRRASQLAPYMHNGYFGQARSSYMLGEIDRAETLMAQARDKATDDQRQQLYERKLSALTSR